MRDSSSQMRCKDRYYFFKYQKLTKLFCYNQVVVLFASLSQNVLAVQQE